MEVDDNTWIFKTLQGLLPEQTLQLLHEHVLHPSSTLRTVSSQVASTTYQAVNVMKPIAAPILQPLADRSLRALQDSPDLVVLGFVLALFFLVFRVLLFMHRTMMYVTRLAVRALVWTCVGLALYAAWQRGPEATIRDLVVVVSKVVGYAAVVKDIWLSEYQKYDAQTRGGPSFAAGGGGNGGGGVPRGSSSRSTRGRF